jgi:hypothetical protein
MKGELTLYFCLTLLIAGLIASDRFSPSADTKEHSTRIIDFSELNTLILDLHCDVYLTGGDQDQLVIEGPGEIVNSIYSEESHGRLTITAQATHGFFGMLTPKTGLSEQIKVYVTLASAGKLKVSDCATLISSDVRTDDMQYCTSLASDAPQKGSLAKALENFLLLGNARV